LSFWNKLVNEKRRKLMKTGYIVMRSGKAQMLVQWAEDGVSTLALGDRATLFETYDRARNAIRRTVNHSFSMQKSDFQIVRVEAE
jgi:peroxiredoxin family protein